MRGPITEFMGLISKEKRLDGFKLYLLSLAALGYIFKGVCKKIYFFIKYKSCGLCDFLITNLSIIGTNKRIKDEKYYIHNIFTTLSQ